MARSHVLQDMEPANCPPAGTRPEGSALRCYIRYYERLSTVRPLKRKPIGALPYVRTPPPGTSRGRCREHQTVETLLRFERLARRTAAAHERVENVREQ
jgi:hypothetical protein